LSILQVSKDILWELFNPETLLQKRRQDKGLNHKEAFSIINIAEIQNTFGFNGQLINPPCRCFPGRFFPKKHFNDVNKTPDFQVGTKTARQSRLSTG